MLRIGDIVQKSDRGADVGDVQIGWYPNSPLNAKLTENFMFTATAEAGKHSSLEILKKIRNTYFDPNPENRLTVIATYGHGKTHLALALANFFGKPLDSPEVNNLLGGIRDANPDLWDGFRSFKEANAPFLIVRLQGNDSGSLHRLFLNALSQALTDAEPVIGKVRLPFWFDEAATFLENLSEDRIARADTFLVEKGHDCASLIAALRKHDESVYPLCRDLSRHLNGVFADFGSEVSLNAAIKWVTDHYCGRDKPLRGMLVLFDEFAVFVERYAERRVGSNAGALQQLLDGIADAKNSACFVAFAQADPDDVAKRFFARDGVHSASESDLTKELTRLPPDARYRLHSSLERVLDSYLSQNPDLWQQFAADSQVDQALQDATDLTVQLLPARYDYKTGWGVEEVYDRLTYGCFPLHPLTTGLLCTLQLQQGTVTRSVLGSVRQALETIKEEPILRQNRPNWLHPARLVDWFGDMISDPATFDAYSRALQSVGGDASEVDKDIIKSVLVQNIANLVPTSQAPGAYAQLISHLSGHPTETCAAALQLLTERYLLEKDPVKDLYRFPAGGDGEQARRLQKSVEQRAKETKITTPILNEDLRTSNRLIRQPAENLAAGNAGDYAAQEWVILKSDFTVDYLRTRIGKRFHISAKGWENGERGAIVYLLATNDEEVTFFATEAERILNEAFPANNGVCLPIVVGLPTTPRPQLLRRLRNERTLNYIAFGSEGREYGTTVREKVRTTFKAEVDADMRGLRDDVRWIVPAVFAAEVNRVAAKNDWRIKLDCCYRMAYADMPPAFKKQYTATTANLRRAVQQVAEPLATGKLKAEFEPVRRGNAMTRDIIDYLISDGQLTSWTLLDSFGATQIPSKPRLLKAWEHLNSCFTAGSSVPIRDAILPLFNPSFGYDWNHATLLFCAWVGYHGSRLKWEERGVAKSVYDYVPLLSKSDNFIATLCVNGVTLRQLDEESEAKRIRELVTTLRQTRLQPSDARSYRIELNNFALNTGMDGETRSQAEKLSQDLAVALKKAEVYEQEAHSILRILTTTAGIPEVLQLLSQIESDSLTKPTLVSAEMAPSIAELREKVRTHVVTLIQRDMARCSVLRGLEQYDSYQETLEKAKQYAIGMGEWALKSKIEAQRIALEERRKELESDQKDKELLGELQKIQPFSAPLVQLEEQQLNLETISAFGERTQELLDKKKTDIRKAITEANEFLEKLPERLDNLTTVLMVNDLQRMVDKREHIYIGSDKVETFQQYDARLNKIHAALDSLSKVPLRSLDTPREMNDREAEINETLTVYGDALATGQRDLFQKYLLSLRERRQSETDKALLWIDKYEAKPPRDISLLDDPSPFLSVEGKKRLKALRERLQEEFQKRTDRDGTETILRHFAQLSSAKQRECLELLQRQLAAQAEKTE